MDAERQLKVIINLTRLARTVKTSVENTELNHAGRENFLDTFVSLAKRHKKFATD